MEVTFVRRHQQQQQAAEALALNCLALHREKERCRAGEREEGERALLACSVLLPFEYFAIITTAAAAAAVLCCCAVAITLGIIKSFCIAERRRANERARDNSSVWPQGKVKGKCLCGQQREKRKRGGKRKRKCEREKKK